MTDDVAAQVVAVLSRIVQTVAAVRQELTAVRQELTILKERMAAHENGLAGFIESATKRSHVNHQVSEQLSALAGSLGK